MWNYFSEDTGAFPALNKMEKIYIVDAGGTQLERVLTVFSTWILSESKPGLYGQKKSCWGAEVMSENIGTIFFMFGRGK